MVRPAGAVPSRRPETIRGERNASGSQQPDVPLDLAFAPGKHGEAANPAIGQLVDPLAGLGNRDQQRSRDGDGLIGVLCAGTWMMPLTAAGTGLVQGTVIVVTLAMRGADEPLLAGIVGLGRLDALPQPKLEMVRSQCHALEMALEEVDDHCRATAPRRRWR